MFACRLDSIVSLCKSDQSGEEWSARIEDLCVSEEATDKACYRRHQSSIDEKKKKKTRSDLSSISFDRLSECK